MRAQAQRTLPLEGGGLGGGESVKRSISMLAHFADSEMSRPTLSPHPLTPAPSRGGGAANGFAL